MPIDVTVDMNKRCAECGQGGATGNGLCLRCTTRAMQGKAMRSATGRRAQAAIRRRLDAMKAEGRDLPIRRCGAGDGGTA